MNRAIQIALALSIWAVPGLCDQNGLKPPKAAPAPRAVRGGPHAEAPKVGAQKAPGMNNPANPVQRFLRMTPDEQERVMEKAPPQQQARLREQLERFQSLPPQQRDWLIRQWQAFDRLPTEKQQLVRQAFEGFNQLPDDRKMLVRAEVNALRRLPENERLTRIGSEEFRNKYSSGEQQIVSGLAVNLPPDYPLAGR